VVAFDATGLIDYASPLVKETLGFAPDELVGRPTEVLVPDRFAEGHRAWRADFLAAPVSVSGLERVGRRQDGSELPVQVTLNPVRTRDGLWVVCALDDISARRDTEERLQATSRAYLTLARINEAIIRADDVGSLYAATCAVAVEHGGFLGAWVGVPDPDGTVRSVATAGRLDAYVEELGITVDPTDPRGRGPTGTTLREGVATFADDFLLADTTVVWHERGRAYGIRSAGVVPLHEDGRLVAALTLYADRPGIFDDGLRSLLDGVARNVSFALDGYAAARRLQQVAGHRRELLRRLASAQEHERSRIAADVHDDSVQALAAVDLRLGLLRGRVATAAPELEESVAWLQETVTSVTSGLRQLLFDLEPVDASVPLVDTLCEMTGQVFDGHPVAWTVTPAATEASLPSELAPDLPRIERGQAMRIVKEALINVRKHAAASRVTVTLGELEDGVEIVVVDDGVGIDLDAEHHPGHRGLASMRDRASVSGGWCRVENDPVGGTTVRVWLPRLQPSGR
jgi:PAS domain S-box-containing protein